MAARILAVHMVVRMFVALRIAAHNRAGRRLGGLAVHRACTGTAVLKTLVAQTLDPGTLIRSKAAPSTTARHVSSPLWIVARLLAKFDPIKQGNAHQNAGMDLCLALTLFRISYHSVWLHGNAVRQQKNADAL